MPQKRIAYSISSHGFGHAARSAAVLRELAGSYEFFISSQIEETFFRTILPDFHFRNTAVDTGCVQADFIAVDRDRSFIRLEELLNQAGTLCLQEKQWLEQNGIDLLISDVPSIPLKAAYELGIPSMVIANFTWYDIYAGFPEAARHPSLVATLREHYASATLQALPQIHVNNAVISRQEEVGLLSLPGDNIQSRIEEQVPLEWKEYPRVLVYLGQYDSSAFEWARLGELKEVLLLTRDPVPSGLNIPNLVVLDETFRFPDLIASSDLVVTKAGYSTLATAFSHGKPVVTCDRPGFREFEAVKSYLMDNKIGIILQSQAFYQAKWADSIKEALKLTVKGKVRLNGEREIRRLIQELIG